MTQKKGMSWPFGSRLEGGFFPFETGSSLVKNNLSQLLRTERGERVMLPKFGCNLRKFLFQPIDQTTFDAIKEEILTSIHRYIKGVTVLKLKVEEGSRDLNSIVVTVFLRIKDSENTIEAQVII